MWWGASEGGQGGSPPPDPPAEQGDSSQGGDAAVVRQELGDLKDQFDEQQALIGQLKDMLKKKEATLSSREKEVQDYAERLARMKPRLGRRVSSKSKQSPGPSECSESGESSGAGLASAQVASVSDTEQMPSPASHTAEERLGPPVSEEEVALPPIRAEGRVVEEKRLSSSESSSRAKILLLRKQLQENRLKFQRQHKDDEKLAMEEMKQRIERLRAEVEQRDDLIQALEGRGPSQEEPSMQKLYQQIVYKDNTILDLTQKLTHLEGVIQEQQEQLSEKDKIIEARTEAVSLIAKAQDEKSLKTLEELEEVRYQMKKMQENFILKEQELTAERDSLSKELKDKIKKVNQLEDNGRRLENLRFEMSTRNAELQEKIVGLQSDAKALREQSEAERQTYSEKDSLIQELKQKLVKAEAHGQKKLKALEKQLKGIKQDGNAGEKILELQNAIAELEEEKGNLQLKLVDFDDLKVTNEKLTSVRNKLEDHVKQLNCDLDSQLSAITQLETEKIKLVEGINERENRIFDLESELSGLKLSLEEIKQAKVTLDLRLCEVEEQRDTAEKLKLELENQMTESGRVPVEQLLAEKGSLEESLQSIMKEREEWEQKYLGQIETVQDCEKKTKSAVEERDQKARECKRLMNILTDKENAIATLSIQIDKHDAVVASVEKKVRLANEEAEKLQVQLNNVNQKFQSKLQELQDTHSTIAEMEGKLKGSVADLHSKEEELSASRNSLETLNRSLNERNITVQNLVGEVSALQEEVKMKERSVDDLINKLERLELQNNNCEKEIERLCSTLTSRDDQISCKNMEVESLKKDLLNSTKQLEATKSSLECELDTLSAMLSDTKNQVESLQVDLQVKEKEIQNNQVIISKYEQEVCDKNQTLDDLQVQCQELQARLSSSSAILSEKESVIFKLQNEIEEKLSTLESMHMQQVSLEQKILHLEEENKSLSEERSRLEEECNEKVGSIEILNNTLSERMASISNLEASVGSYTSELHSKASEVEKWQSEALEKGEQVNALTLQLGNIQSDAGSKDTLVANLQEQLLQNHEQISGLQSRLQQVEGSLAENQQALLQAQEQLTENQHQLTANQEQYMKLKGEFDANQSQLAETNSQYEKATALATHFEEELRKKASNLEAAEKQMASQEESSVKELSNVQHDVEHLRSEVTRLEAELQASKEQANALQAEISRLQEQSKQIQEDSETCRKEYSLKCEEVTTLQENLSQIQYQANSFQEQLTQTVSYQEQYQQQIHSLQEQLNQALNLKQQSDSEIAALSVTQLQRISQLEGELLALTQARDYLQAELEKSSIELQNQRHALEEEKVSVENLLSQSSTKDSEIQMLQNNISVLQNTEQELKNLVKELEEEKAQFKAFSGPEDTSGVHSQPAVDSEVKTLRDELARALDQSKFLEEECDGLRGDANTLKQQLQDARQTITHLQTSLATTQSQGSSSAGGWGDWGEVDLGSPAPAPEELPQQSSSLISSLQKSLADKDEMLTMMQDQLKETLQEINAINEEKKILEKQKQTAESNIAKQMESWKEEKEELNRMRLEAENAASVHGALEEERKKMAILEQDLLEKRQAIEGLTQQLMLMQSYQQTPVQDPSQATNVIEPVVAGGVQEEVITSQVQATQQEGANLFGTVQWPQTGNEDAASWFDQAVGNEAPATDNKQVAPVQTAETSVDQVQTQDPASWFNQQEVKDAPLVGGDQVAVTQSIGLEGDQSQDPASWFDQQVASGVAAVSEEVTATQGIEQTQESQGLDTINVEELQYKLSWYEEQWSTWTGHYSQLQTSYQEAEEKVAMLTEQLQALQVEKDQLQALQEEKDQGASAEDGRLKEETQSVGHEEAALALSAQAQEIRTKLEDAEKALEGLREENQRLQLEATEVAELRAQLGVLQERTRNEDPTRLQEAEAEVDHLRGFETQVYELQSQVQALQHQCTAMQNKLSEAETEVGRLREIEALYGELQSCIQESETKREGSKSRVQELELMVQSAESEIARLRNEIEVLSQGERNRGELQDSGDVSGFRSQVLSLQNEVDKCQSEIDYYKAEMGRLENENQNMGDEMARARSDLQRLEQENSQLRSELEVFEGELDRMRSSCEMYEAENNRVRGDYEALSQASQMTEAEKESLESEVQRITAQNMALSADSEHLRDEIQRLTEVSTSAETEIVRLQTEIERFKLLDQQYNNLESKYNELQAQVTSMESAQSSKTSESEPHSLVVEEVDWSAEGRIEDEHLQRSSSVDLKYQEEIDDLKEKVIAIEKEKNATYDELQAAKLKSGKMLQKLKLTQSKNESLTKEIQKLKAKAGGFSDLDQALEEEWKAQVTKAETERDEYKQKLDEVENEKENLLTQIDVLTAAQEEYIEMKEDQDTTIKLLKARNKEVEGQIQALEWKITELEEVVEQQRSGDAQEPIIHPRSSAERELGLAASDHHAASKEIETLRDQVASLQREAKIFRSENERLQTAAKELEEAVETLSQENETFQSIIEGLKDAKTKAESDTNNYKSIYIELHDEHESVKKEKEKTNEELKELTYAHDTLKAAYNSLYAEYNDLRDVCDSHKHDVGILKGERDRLVEEINSLKNQLQALHEEEEEETIRALQDECSSLREQNNLLHEENTALEVKTEDAIEKTSRLENTLEQNVEMQKLLQEELMKKSEEINFHTVTIEDNERQMTYLKAEMAALKAKLSQQDQAEESTLETTQKLEAEVEQLQERNHQLLMQVEAAEASLAKLAGGKTEGGDTVFAPVAPATTELDAALASLHLRDLRCQQLSLEITKLLEERDALQLKLSASLRQTQELTRELSLSHQLPAPVSPEPSLDQKLAELRELNDSLEQKALLSLQGAASATVGRRITVGGLPSPPIFTPHTAPPTPTATRHADYTLTREAQGTSTTLIDWIMGKSTPRVLHV
ncbi:LOW QUALITY PROTEIN: golgin subfamily B member 1-like [Macrobrachium nipponense]|uniref:LOW QUALITY PROTEIN: golgin subfamily B member 1-like n=1 Tax=Macrobrachium nipponense TaxID=159736 RepID=UPI0030C85FE0